MKSLREKRHEHIAKMLAAYQERLPDGRYRYTTRELAKKFGVAKGDVGYHAKKAGLSRPDAVQKSADHDAIAQDLLTTQLSVVDIADKNKTSTTTVRTVANETKVSLQGRWGGDREYRKAVAAKQA